MEAHFPGAVPMSNNDTAPVIDLQQRHADARLEQEQIGHLFAATRNLALGRISDRLEALFENVDDALFDMAEKAESNMLQTHYFDGMRELRRKRQLVERLFNEGLRNKFAEFSKGKLKPFSEEYDGSAADMTLSLVEDEELEESLAVNEMVHRALNRYKSALFALHERFSVSRGGAQVDDETNPLSPGHVGAAFRHAIADVAVEVPVKIIVYKLFDRYVMAGMSRVYDEVNAHLIKQGVLPNLKQSSHRNAAAGGPLAEGRPGHRYADEMMGENGSAGATETLAGPSSQVEYENQGGEPNILQTLQQLLTLRSDESGINHMPTSRPRSQVSEFLSAITALQQEAGMAPTTGYARGGSGSGGNAGGLLSHIRSLTQDAKKSTSGADSDTIDLVGMLFEYILRDKNLPSAIQASLARLQIPYLKVAVLDRQFFAMREHPARRLLDGMADAGLGWSEESDRNGDLLEKINNIVESLLNEFDDDLAIFDHLLVDFESFMKAHRRKSEAAEKRTAEATQGKEKLNQARKNAAREILQRVKGIELPPVIHGLLTKPWANALVLTELRQGQDSDAWRSAVEMVESLIWSGLPKPTDSDRQRLIRMIPKLETRLRSGLELVAYHENDIETLLSDLRQSWALLLRTRNEDSEGEEKDIPSLKLPDGSEALPESGFVEDLAASPEQLDPVVVTATDEVDDSLAALSVGMWVELTQEDGNTMRAKLSWISPISGNYLLVNRRGLKVADMTREDLAAELRNGTATMLEDVSLMDRALDAIANKLRSTDSETPAEAVSESEEQGELEPGEA